MSKIFINNLNDSLKEIINSSGGANEEQINEIVQDALKDYTTKAEVNTTLESTLTDYATKDELLSKQDKEDENLNTEDKTIIGAINELNTDINNINNSLNNKSDKLQYILDEDNIIHIDGSSLTLSHDSAATFLINEPMLIAEDSTLIYYTADTRLGLIPGLSYNIETEFNDGVKFSVNGTSEFNKSINANMVIAQFNGRAIILFDEVVIDTANNTPIYDRNRSTIGIIYPNTSGIKNIAISLPSIIELNNLFFNNFRFVTNNEKENWNNKADRSELFSKDYNDLTNKPIIPSVEGLASEEYVDEQIENITNNINDFEIENNVKMIAHRGFSSEAPENTIVAYKLAGMRGYWGAECDIQETSDGHLILMHDDTVDRTTNGTGKVSEMTLEQINALTVKIKAGYYEKVPTLEEYLICCKQYNLVPIIEIKASINIDNFIQIVRDQGMEDKVIVISFSNDILINLRNLSNKIKIQTLTFVSIEQCLQYNFDIDINYTDSWVTKENIKNAHNNNIKVNVWTVNDTNVMNNLINIGVDYITTDALNLEACEGNRLCKIERTSLTIPEKASLNLLSSMRLGQSDLEPIRFNYHTFTITERRNGEYVNTGTNSNRIVSNPIATLGCYYYKIEFDSSICKLTLHPFNINNKQIADLGWFKSNDIYKLPLNTSHFFIYCSRADDPDGDVLTDSEVNAIKSSIKITRMYYSSENDVVYTTSNIKYVNGHPDISTIGNNIGNDDNAGRCITNTRYNAVSTLVRVNFDSSLIKLTVSSASATNERLADIGWLTDGNVYNLPNGTDWFYIYFAPVNGTSFTDEQKLAVANATVTCLFFEEPIYQPINDNTLNTEDKTIVGAINELAQALGNLQLLRITQEDYDTLATKDPNTLYIIV